MNQTDIYEIKRLILEQNQKLEKLELLIPEKFDISFVVKKTGLTRQAIRQRLYIKFEHKVDFWMEGDKIYMSQKVALQMLKRGV
ncbi:hypothetical protein ACOTVV_10130 [Aliarcobacter butzleri]|jgi:hypothetical protein|uniref:hypothetical protein n=1 Tax=Aliarcobacter butzleri TaxID=28197 RepID=UPI0021B4966D|nr:hypothetical protein [Aliarcobacter butzleri]MCT7597274.1 hypothetical protein [Aliarcobacter butzleri]